MPTIVFSLGGSILLPSLDSPNIAPYVPVLKQIASKYRLFVVVGGGGEARKYISIARDFNIDDAAADELGIMVTRINAQLLVCALGSSAWPAVVTDYSSALCAAEHGKIVVMGGITPGQTTDAVSAVLAERTRASLFVNLTSVDGIYSADPKKVPDAVHYDYITPSDFLEIIAKQEATAGINTVMDVVAVKMVERCNIPLLVMDGRNPADLSKALETGEYAGTIVSNTKRNLLPLAE